jgi:hypothetical protein
MNVRQTLEFPQRVTDDGRQCIPSYSRKFVSAETRARLEHLVAPHVDSFDYFLDSGLRAAVQDLPTYELKVGVTGLRQGWWLSRRGGDLGFRARHLRHGDGHCALPRPLRS